MNRGASIRGGRSSTRLPRVEIALVRPVPGALVRLLPGLFVLLCAPLVGADVWTVGGAGAAAVLVVRRPASPVAAVVSLLVGLVVLAGDDLLAVGGSGDGRSGWRLAGLLLTVHLVLRTAELASHVAWRARVELSVLGRVLGGVLAVQAVAQTVLLSVLVVRSVTDAGEPGAGAGQEWLRAVAVGGAVVISLLAWRLGGHILRTRRRDAERGPSDHERLFRWHIG
ncbi:MAG: hypothetical protein GXX79_02155 [Actinomycetales bacterium]|nr:hypothetical protein [Actinomycetales bacterium]